MGNLTANFSRHEIVCKCKKDCGAEEVTDGHLSMMQTTRNIYGSPLGVSSAARCKAHNKAVGGKDNSEHIATKDSPAEATDHPYENTLDLHNLVTAAHKAGFIRVGIDFKNKFVHLGSSIHHPKPRLWGY